MTWQICFEVSVDVFKQSEQWHPNTRVRSFRSAADYNDKCTCEEIIQRQMRSGVWSGDFTVKILCLSSAALGQAFDLLWEDPNGNIPVFGYEQRKSIMFNLKQLCECDRKSAKPQENEIANEWGLLDMSLIKRNGSVTRCSSIAPVSMAFDQIMRPTPSVLHLVSLKSSSGLRQRVNKEVERMILAKTKSRDHDDGPGYIYIMQRDSMPEYVKIGFSQKHPAVRHDALQACFKDNDLRVIAHTNQIPHASKVKRLVHAELMYFNRWQDCGQCGDQHQDWFEIHSDIAKQAVLRWSRWMAAAPYERYGGDLKKIWRERLLSKKVDNLVVAVNRYINSYTKQPSVDQSDSEAKELTGVELLRHKVQSVKMISVEKEVSRWHSMPEELRATEDDSDDSW